jgi:hypothetical protein
MDIDVRVVIAGAAFALGLLQLYLAWRKERFESTMWIFERLQSPESTIARFRVRALLKKAKERAGNLPAGTTHEPEYDFAGMDDKDRAAMASIASLFGLAGLLFRLRRIDRRLFLDAWANSVLTNFERLRPYMKWRDARLGQDNTLWREFESFSALITLKRKKPGWKA